MMVGIYKIYSLTIIRISKYVLPGVGLCCQLGQNMAPKYDARPTRSKNLGIIFIVNFSIGLCKDYCHGYGM